MKHSRLFAFVVCVVLILNFTDAFAQHWLQLDDGHAHYSIIEPNISGGIYLLPPGGGTLIVVPPPGIPGLTWFTAGNGSLTDLTNNFLGTTDATPLRIVTGAADAAHTRILIGINGDISMSTLAGNTTIGRNTAATSTTINSPVISTPNIPSTASVANVLVLNGGNINTTTLNVVTGSGNFNTIPKWTTNPTGSVLGNSLLIDDGITLNYNGGEFTVLSANGNTAIAGMLTVGGADVTSPQVSVSPTGAFWNEGIAINPSTGNGYDEIFFRSTANSITNTWTLGREPVHGTGDFIIGRNGLLGMVGTSGADRPFEISASNGTVNFGGPVGIGIGVAGTVGIPIGLLANTTGNTIFPGGVQGVGAGALNWQTNSIGYAVSITNQDNAATADGVGIDVSDVTGGAYALNVTNGNLALQAFYVKSNGNTSVGGTLGVTGVTTTHGITANGAAAIPSLTIPAGANNQLSTNGSVGNLNDLFTSQAAVGAPQWQSTTSLGILTTATGVEYNIAAPQNTATPRTNWLFNVNYAAAAPAANAAGAVINSSAGGGSNATGLTVTATGTGTVVGVAATASGGASNYDFSLPGANGGTLAVPDYANNTSLGGKTLSIYGGNAANGAFATGGTNVLIHGGNSVNDGSWGINQGDISLIAGYDVYAGGSVTAKYGNILFKTGSAATEIMRVNGQTGRVGINQPAPGTLLDVNGTFNATGLSTLAAITTVGTASINGSGAASTTIGNIGAGTTALNSTVISAPNIGTSASQTNVLVLSGGNILTSTWTAVAGSGTVNFIPLWTPDGSTLGNSRLFDDNTTTNITSAANFIPSADVTYNLGSITNRWQELYLGPASMHLYGLAAEVGGTLRDWSQGIDATGNFTLKEASAVTTPLTISPTGDITLDNGTPIRTIAVAAGTGTDLRIKAGDNAAGKGGRINIDAGNAAGGNYVGGPIDLIAGDASGIGNHSGGAITLKSGAAVGSGQSNILLETNGGTTALKLDKNQNATFSQTVTVNNLPADGSVNPTVVTSTGGTLNSISASSLASLTSWALVGNTGLTPGTNNFLGTTDAVDVVMEAGAVTQMTLRNAGGINIPNSSPSGVGVIFQNGVSLIHTYNLNNMFVGLNAGNFTLTGTNDVGFGPNVLNNLSAGSQNTGVGAYALVQPTTGSNNTGVGYNALNLVNGGSDNTAVGNAAGLAINGGTQNTFLGSTADATGDYSNATAIGYGASVGANNEIQLGNGGVTLVNMSGALTTGLGITATFGNITAPNGTLVSGASTGGGAFGSVQLYDGTDAHFGWIYTPPILSADQYYTLPDATGTFVLDVTLNNNTLPASLTTLSVSSLPASSSTTVVTSNAGVLESRSAASLAALTSWTLIGNSELADGTNNFLGTTDATPVRFITNDTTRMYLDPNGLVGIGTTTPVATLDIVSPTTTGLQVLSQDVVGSALPVQILDNTAALTFGTNTYGRLMRLEDIGQNVFYDLGIDGSGSFFIMNQNTTSQAITLSPTGTVNIGNLPAGTQTLVVTSNGGTLETNTIAALAATTSWALGGNTTPFSNIFGTLSGTDVVMQTGGTTQMTLVNGGGINMTPGGVVNLQATTGETKLHLTENATFGGISWDFGVSNTGPEELGYIESGFNDFGIFLNSDNNPVNSGTFTVYTGDLHTGAPTQLFKVDGVGNGTFGGGLTVTTLPLDGSANPNVVTSTGGTLNSVSAASLAALTSWTLVGNSGLVDGTNNFLGTTNATPIRFVTNGIGNTRMFIDGTTGNVGIGTTVANAKLSFGAVLGVPLIHLWDGAPSDRYGFGINASELQTFIPTGAHFSWNDGSDLQVPSGTNELMRLSSSTGVLSNTTNNPLDQFGAHGISGSGILWQGIGQGYAGSISNLDNSTPSSNGLLVQTNNPAATTLIFTANDGSTATDRFRIFANGHVQVTNLPASSSTLVVTSNLGVLESRSAASLVSLTAWTLGGNTGLIAGTNNQLGTLDATDVLLVSGSGGPNTRMTISGTNGNVAIGTAVDATNRLELNGNIGFNTAGNKVTNSSTDLTMEQTGDFFGTSQLVMQDRVGSNGALFTQSPNGAHLGTDLVDFGLKPGAGVQSNIRLEARTASMMNPANTEGELEFISNSTGAFSFPFAVGKASATFNESVGIGVLVPTQTLDVNGTARIRTLSGAGTNIVTADGSGVLGNSTLIALGGATGTGTANTMTKWTGVNTIGNSVLTDNGSTLGYSGSNLTQTTVGGAFTIATVANPNGATGTLALITGNVGGGVGNGVSGDLNLATGDNLTNAAPGTINISGGNSNGFGTTNHGGNVAVTGGGSNNGNGGNISLTAGSNVATSGNGGNVSITAGTGLTANGTISLSTTGVDISINPGASNTVSTNGKLQTTGDATIGGNLNIHGANYTWPASSPAGTNVLTNTGGALTWAAAAAGFSLPYAATVNSGSNLFDITNSGGTASAIRGAANSISNPGILGTNSAGDGIDGLAGSNAGAAGVYGQGSNNAGTFGVFAQGENTGDALHIRHAGTGLDIGATNWSVTEAGAIIPKTLGGAGAGKYAEQHSVTAGEMATLAGNSVTISNASIASLNSVVIMTFVSHGGGGAATFVKSVTVGAVGNATVTLDAPPVAGDIYNLIVVNP